MGIELRMKVGERRLCDGRKCRSNLTGCAATILSRHTYICTLPKGHDGPHIACGIDDHNIKVWSYDDG